jgi:hypothetical protein
LNEQYQKAGNKQCPDPGQHVHHFAVKTGQNHIPTAAILLKVILANTSGGITFLKGAIACVSNGWRAFQASWGIDIYRKTMDTLIPCGFISDRSISEKSHQGRFRWGIS